MDQELLREYRTLHTLQRALEDAGKAADYLSRRLEQAGFRITGQGTAVLAIRDSALPGLAIGFGARLEMQDTPSGAAHTEGNDAACAMALTAAIRAASRLSRGRVSCLFWDGRETPDFFYRKRWKSAFLRQRLGKPCSRRRWESTNRFFLSALRLWPRFWEERQRLRRSIAVRPAAAGLDRSVAYAGPWRGGDDFARGLWSMVLIL